MCRLHAAVKKSIPSITAGSAAKDIFKRKMIRNQSKVKIQKTRLLLILSIILFNFYF
jgi:hypothetical protein